jgi:hypothetical protein
MEGLGGNKIGSVDPVVVYAIIWGIAFIWLNIRWSIERRNDREEEGEDTGPVTLVDRLIGLGARLGINAILAWLWPYFVLAFLWIGLQGLFRFLRPRRDEQAP